MSTEEYKGYFRISKPSIDNPGRTVCWNADLKAWMLAPNGPYTAYYSESHAKSAMTGLIGR